ncbi:MAG: hypothetical protein P8107_09850, partial [Spirochaetia bacterium]
METTFISLIIFCTFIAGFILFVAAASMKALNILFQEIAQRYNLEFIKGSIFGSPMVKGIINGVDFECSVYRISKSSNGIKIQANPVQCFPFEICLKKETYLTRLKNMIGMSDIRTGDNNFDDKILINGHEAGVISMLNERARSIILNLVD